MEAPPSRNSVVIEKDTTAYLCFSLGMTLCIFTHSTLAETRHTASTDCKRGWAMRARR